MINKPILGLNIISPNLTDKIIDPFNAVSGLNYVFNNHQQLHNSTFIQDVHFFVFFNYFIHSFQRFSLDLD
jgi:hypothetical protein